MAIVVRIDEAAVERLARQGVAPLVDRALDAGTDAAKRLVPIDTGHLQSRIEVKERAHDTETGVSGTYGVDDVDYAEHVEFGTSRMAAQPYLRPSIDATKQVIR